MQWRIGTVTRGVSNLDDRFGVNGTVATVAVARGVPTPLKSPFGVAAGPLMEANLERRQSEGRAKAERRQSEGTATPRCMRVVPEELLPEAMQKGAISVFRPSVWRRNLLSTQIGH